MPDADIMGRFVLQRVNFILHLIPYGGSCNPIQHCRFLALPARLAVFGSGIAANIFIGLLSYILWYRTGQIAPGLDLRFLFWFNVHLVLFNAIPAGNNDSKMLFFPRIQLNHTLTRTVYTATGFVSLFCFFLTYTDVIQEAANNIRSWSNIFF
ncbi:MAG: hypothetical protein QHH75_10220 [Bacillota bacterium]|nr:hypothetical protein [Bacillota bacterium]